MGAIVLLVVAYLLGSISGSLVLGRLVGVDIRTRGSGNAGGTNALRTMGWRFALGVVLVDVGKGALAAAVGARFSEAGSAWPLAAVAAACLGHVWPVFHGFRGGKGAATLVGGLAVLWPLALVPVLGVWILLLIATGYVGLSTICAAAVLPPLAWVLRPTWSWLAFGLFAAVFILFTHRGNVQRLVRGEEPRFERVRAAHWLRRNRV